MYSQSVRRKALDALMLTGDVEKSARMSGVSSRTLRRWASSAAKPQQRSCGAKFKPYGGEIRSKCVSQDLFLGFHKNFFSGFTKFVV